MFSQREIGKQSMLKFDFITNNNSDALKFWSCTKQDESVMINSSVKRAAIAKCINIVRAKIENKNVCVITKIFRLGYQYESSKPVIDGKIIDIGVNDSDIRDTSCVLKITKDKVMSSLKKLKT